MKRTTLKKLKVNPSFRVNRKSIRGPLVDLIDLDKYDRFIERKIIIGMIVNDEFCLWATENFNSKYFGSRMATRLSSWVYEYFNEYKKAPRKDIEGIYFQKLKEGLPEVIAEEIEQDILPGLSEEYVEKGLNLQYLKDRSQIYLKRQIFTRKLKDAEGLIENNQFEEAIDLLTKELPSQNNLSSYIKTIDEMEKEGVKRPRMLLSPWLREGETTLLYSEAGVGKSLLAILIAYVLGLENYTEKQADIGSWQVKCPVGTLYIDGELGKAEILDRTSKYKWIGKQRYPIEFICVPEYQIESGKDITLSKRKTQREIIAWLKKNPNYKLLIIDSISTVFCLENENDNSEWSKKINPFIKDLRAMGVAHIIQHHSGKDSKKGLRGASAMTAMAHNIIRLTNHPSKQPGYAWFKVDNKEKQRAAGALFDAFYIKFNPMKDRTEWEVSKDDSRKKDTFFKLLKEFVNGNLGNKELASKYGLKSGENVAYYKKKARDKGYLRKDNSPTKKGIEVVKSMEEEEDSSKLE